MMARYDIDLVKTAAEGRWRELISSIGNVDANLLDGSHHGCPKSCHPDAGGKDRFRALNDFDSTGGVFCNQCFSTKNRSGFDALQWLLGEDFGTVLAKVAKHLGIKAIKGRKKANPADMLEFLPWNRTLVGLWCLTKKPISIETVQRLGWKVAKYRKQFTVIAIPIWGPALDAEDAVGWVLYRADGGKLPKYSKKDDQPEWVKVKLTAGSQQGLIADLAKWKNASVTKWGKVEGPSDLGSIESAFSDVDRGWFTTANGSKEKPLDWIIERLKDCEVVVIHDCDKPGQEGATWVEQVETGRKRAGWCPAIAEVAREVRNIVLPFPIEPTHGPDLRDFFYGGSTAEDLIGIIERTAAWAREEVTPADEEWIEKAGDDPSYLAEVNLRNYRLKGRNLVYWRNEWLQYKQNRYEHIAKDDLSPRILIGIQEEYERQWHASKKDKPVRQVPMSKVRDVIEHTKSRSSIGNVVNLGSWIAEDKWKWSRRVGPTNCVALKNGVLCLDKLFEGAKIEEFLLPHSPEWFSSACLEYDYDAGAKCPTWEKFLNDAFNNSEEAIMTLQKWIGYLLVHDMSLEKIMFIIGKKRSGKGTIMKTIVELLGESAVASPSLNAFAGQYFLDSLVGKTAVVIPDVRLSRRADNVVITERLLSISGGDPQDVERKYLGTLNGVKMQCRFTLFSNMLPYLEDSSAAFVSRCIFLPMPNSYYGREDLTLFPRIKEEMSGILNWAIMGQYRLREHKRIEQPESGLHLKRQMESMAAPVKLFLDDRVVLMDDATRSVSVHELYEVYCEWCNENDRVKKMDQEHFRRSIRDVHPNVEIKPVSLGGKRESRVFGMAIKQLEGAY
jgi:P4 family phage/plasmid primase-like protien